MNATPESLPMVEDVEDRLDLNEEGKRAMADIRWMHLQHRLGHFTAYPDEYVGVFEQRIVGHNKSLIQLRREVEQGLGITPTNLATMYIPNAKGTGVGRMCLV